MKTLVIIGAGQFGRAASCLINTGEYRLIAFGDNNQNLWNTVFPHPLGARIPILSVEDAAALKPDAVLIGVTDAERTNQLKKQAAAAGFTGRLLLLHDFYEQLDIRSATLIKIAARLNSLGLSGDLAELGVYRGDTAWKLNALFPERRLYLFDTFEGFDSRDTDMEKELCCSRAQESEFSDTSVEAVLARMPHPEQVIVKKGYFPDTAAGLEELTFLLVSLDADLYAPILAGLEYFYPRLVSGGMILLHDYNNERFRGARQAVRDYEAKHGSLMLVPLCDLHGSAVIIRPDGLSDADAAPADRTAAP